MRLLLDTHIVLWHLGGARTLSDEALDAIGAAEELWFSAVSCAEIGVKVAIGKLDVVGDIRAALDVIGVRLLSLRAEHGLAVAGLPLHHRDPFDRLLIAQARAEGLTLVTADAALAHYDVPVLCA
ncbi:MAG: type II toxin-antitoxin system VapC family toxin [Patulibacter sp.]